MASDPTEDSEAESCRRLVQQLIQEDGKLVSPIDLSFEITKPLDLDNLQWAHVEDSPYVMRMTNTGDTVIVSAKWTSQRPYMTGGFLNSNYVFSQIHFHWGASEHEGSEHTINGISYPMEMHVTFFKARYLTQGAALKHDDGMVIVVYLVKLQNRSSSGLQWLCTQLHKVFQPQTSTTLDPSPLSRLLVPFSQDYLFYVGALRTHHCSHTMMWLVSRSALGITTQHLEVFRSLLNSQRQHITKNFRVANPAMGRTVFHVCRPSDNTTHLLLPGAADLSGQELVVGHSMVPELSPSKAAEIFNKGDSLDEFKTKSDDKTKANTEKCSVLRKGLYKRTNNRVLSMNVKTTPTVTTNKIRPVSAVEPINSKVRNEIQKVKVEKREGAMTRKLLERQRKESVQNKLPTPQSLGLSAATVKRLQVRSAGKAAVEESQHKDEDSFYEGKDMCVHIHRDTSDEEAPESGALRKTGRPPARSKLSMSAGGITRKPKETAKIQSSLAPYFSSYTPPPTPPRTTSRH